MNFPFTCTLKVTKDDYIQYLAETLLFKRKENLPWMIIFVGGYLLLTILISTTILFGTDGFYGGAGYFLGSFLFLACMLCSIYFIFPRFPFLLKCLVYFNSSRFAYASHILYGELVLTMTEKEVQIIREGLSSQLPYSTIKTVKTTPSYLLLDFPKHTLLIPQWAFPSSEHREFFMSALPPHFKG